MSTPERETEREAARPAPDPACCGNCPYFKGPSEMAAATGWGGACVRFPQFLPKRSEQLCGEHPRFLTPKFKGKVQHA